MSRVTRTRRSKPDRAWGPLVAWIVGVEAAGALAGLASRPGAWYLSLDRPAWTPPNWLFAPVWTLLYAAMAVAAWLVWQRREDRAARIALVWFGIQLALNVLWTPLFFGFRRVDLAMLDISALWVAIIATMKNFSRIRALAGWLLLPYLAWVSFAAALTLSIWLRNG